MGLFVGASILTILEILDYVYEVCQTFWAVSQQWERVRYSTGAGLPVKGLQCMGHSRGL